MDRPTQRQCADPFILAALKNPDDRAVLLRNDDEFQKFALGPDTQISFPSENDYEHIVMHKLSGYYGLCYSFNAQAKLVVVQKPDDFVVGLVSPVRSLTEEKPVEKPIKLLRKPKKEETDESKNNSPNLSPDLNRLRISPKVQKIEKRSQTQDQPEETQKDTEHPKVTSLMKPIRKDTPNASGNDSAVVAEFPKTKTLEEREEEYAKARARIFSDMQETDTGSDSTPPNESSGVSHRYNDKDDSDFLFQTDYRKDSDYEDDEPTEPAPVLFGLPSTPLYVQPHTRHALPKKSNDGSIQNDPLFQALYPPHQHMRGQYIDPSYSRYPPPPSMQSTYMSSGYRQDFPELPKSQGGRGQHRPKGATNGHEGSYRSSPPRYYPYAPQRGPPFPGPPYVDPHFYKPEPLDAFHSPPYSQQRNYVPYGHGYPQPDQPYPSPYRHPASGFVDPPYTGPYILPTAGPRFPPGMYHNQDPRASPQFSRVPAPKQQGAHVSSPTPILPGRE